MEQPRTAGPARPLGRGLEDVSHVFLSSRADTGASDANPNWRVERPIPRARTAAAVIPLRPRAPITREEMATVLRECDGALEEGLRSIDAEIPCAPCGEIDILAVDRANGLTIVDFEVAGSVELLIRGLGHVDWMARNLPNVRRMFRGQVINFSAEPRLILLAPEFSPGLRCAARQIAHPRIRWVRYHLVETDGGPGILFEPLEAE